MKTLAYFSALFVLVSCENPSKINCVDAAEYPYRTGICEGIGTVVIPENGTAEHMVLDDGTYAVVDIPSTLNAKDGDRIRIIAKFYLGENHIDLVEHKSIEKIEE